jgi:peptidoglycan hydrolase-like protein with peptidoglycan-binding domain
VAVARDLLQERWSGSGYVAWRNYEGLPPLLRAGHSGAAVSFVQRALGELGFYVGDVHGSYDDATERAVAAFQRGSGLSPDGAVGPLTQVRLYHSLPDYRMPLLALGGGAQASAL